MTKELSDYWARLVEAVHPDDKTTFAQFPDHGFNLDFPPPAFIGDVINAPVIILDNNGGYNSSRTPREFPNQQAHRRFREALSNAETASSDWTAPYYLERNYTQWLKSGKAALVNGIAYRSRDGNENRIKELTRRLPSGIFHREWLRKHLLPQVIVGERCVVVHRWARWNGAAGLLQGRDNVIFSTAPISKDLTAQEYSVAAAFLAKRGG